MYCVVSPSAAADSLRPRAPHRRVVRPVRSHSQSTTTEQHTNTPTRCETRRERLFAHCCSAAVRQLEVLRTWPRSVSSGGPVSRYELIDVNRSECNQPIELFCYGGWSSQLSIDKYDVLLISGARAERIAVDDSGSGAGSTDLLECEWRLVVDDSCEQASIIVYNWRDRILTRPGKLHTAASIRDARGSA